jgi:hypothetical protein
MKITIEIDGGNYPNIKMENTPSDTNSPGNQSAGAAIDAGLAMQQQSSNPSSSGLEDGPQGNNQELSGGAAAHND